MNKLTKLKVDIKDWIFNWVSVYNHNLHAVPCPYAKAAVINNQIEFLFSNDVAELHIQLGKIDKMPDGIEVIVVGFDPTTISAEQTVNITNEYNNRFKQCGLIALEDHPMLAEVVSSQRMNNGEWGLILIQNAKKLADASDRLNKAGYYTLWTNEEFDQVVGWRWNS